MWRRRGNSLAVGPRRVCKALWPAGGELAAASLVYGLVHARNQAGPAAVVAKQRDLTLTWSRYDYRGLVIERPSVDRVLDDARRAGARYCFIQFTGHVISEDRHAGGPLSQALAGGLESWARARDFVVAGTVVGGQDRPGLAQGCLLVDLARHRDVGSPPFDSQPPGRDRASRPLRGHLGRHGPPLRFGERVVSACRARGVSVPSLDEVMGRRCLILGTSGRARSAFGRYLGRNVSTFRPDRPDPALSVDQRRLLASVGRQATRARRGVFLFNLEPYDDVAGPPAGLSGRVSALYAVAAGFKPNRILETHGFDDRTRVVFFDYSRTALAVRRRMVDAWDGRDFPGFVNRLLHDHPPSRTFYQGWTGLGTADVRDRVRQAWSAEVSAWGGAASFLRHWRRYRRLEHEFVHCDIVADPAPLVSRIGRQSGAVIWWSNAFFTMYANWLLDVGQRRAAYERWMTALSAANPGLFLYGADDVNGSVNAVTARAYWPRFQRSGCDALRPFRLGRVEIRT